MPDTPQPRRRERTALRSSDQDLARAAEITADDLALLAARAPAVVRPYLEAQPMEEEG